MEEIVFSCRKLRGLVYKMIKGEMLIHINGIAKYILLSLGVFFVATFLSSPILAQSKSNLQEEGERLTRQFWETVKTKY